MRSVDNFRRPVDMVPSRHNTVTLCQGNFTRNAAYSSLGRLYAIGHERRPASIASVNLPRSASPAHRVLAPVQQ
jgi:hypothetical protein